jgi:hypothetical protein
MGERVDIPVYTQEWKDNQIVRFTHHSSVFPEAWDWCIDNCNKKWYSGLPNPFYFYFEDPNDAMLFKLTWG